MKRFPRFLLISGITFVILMYLTEGMYNVALAVGILIGVLTLGLDTKEERKERKAKKKAEEAARKAEEEARKRREVEEERARKAPGCYSKDNVELLTFKSSNNLLTAGNNFITVRIRNKNSYDVYVTLCFKYSDSGEWRDAKTFEVGGNKIRTINTQGLAWRKAKDVTIDSVH